MLVGVAAAWLALAGLVTWSFRPAMEIPARTSAIFLLLEIGALVLGLGAAFLVSEDVDPPKSLLRALPIPYWRTAFVRFVLWFLVSGIVLEVFVRIGDPVVPATAGTLRAAAFPTLLLVAGCSLLGAAVFGSLIGGAATLGLVCLILVAETASPELPLQLRDMPSSTTWRVSRLVATATGGVAALVALNVVSATSPSAVVRPWRKRGE